MRGLSKKHFRCPDPQHEHRGASANWHKDGFCYCFGCGENFKAKELAEWQSIPWRTLVGIQPQIRLSGNIELNAAPRRLETANAPRFYDEPPDSWLRLPNKAYSTMHSALYYYATRLRSAGLLPEALSVQEFVNAARKPGCELNDRAVYDNFEAARHGDDNPLF